MFRRSRAEAVIPRQCAREASALGVHTGVGIRLFGLGRTDCRVASLLAMIECVGHAVPAVPFCAVPVLPCRVGRPCPPWMTAAPRRAGPCGPPFPARSAVIPRQCAPRAVPFGYTWRGNPSLWAGRTDCRVASLLAMTECVGDGVLDAPFRAVPVLLCRGGCLRPPNGHTPCDFVGDGVLDVPL